MTRFIAQLNDGSFLNIPADTMQIDGTSMTVYNGGKLVAYLDMSTVLCAHLSDKVVSG